MLNVKLMLLIGWKLVRGPVTKTSKDLKKKEKKNVFKSTIPNTHDGLVIIDEELLCRAFGLGAQGKIIRLHVVVIFQVFKQQSVLWNLQIEWH